MSEDENTPEFHCLADGEICVGGDFKQYFIAHDMPSALAKLKSGLDAESLKVIDRDLEKFLNYPSWDWSEVFFYKNTDDLLSSEEKEKWTWEWQELRTIQRRAGIEFGTVQTLVYAHGLKEPDLPKKVIDYIRGKSFVDGGASVGDSAFALLEYEPFRIYSFEIDPLKMERLRQNVTSFDKSGLVEIVPMALFSCSRHFLFEATGGGGNSLLNPGKDEVESIALDSFFDARPGEVLGFWKADLGRVEIDALEGARNIITRDRPVLVVGMYWGPESYFEVKPILESWSLGYKFHVRRHAHYPAPYETVLIAYPEELEE